MIRKVFNNEGFDYTTATATAIKVNKVKKLVWADNMRVVATISVILLHMAGSALYQFERIPAYSWWVANLYDSVVRFCVPVFVMLSGALLLPQEVTLSYFLKRRLFRIALPFIFWTCVYYLLDLHLERDMLSHMTLIAKAKWTLVQLEVGTASHLWYLYMIIGLYLFIPIIGRWARNATNNEIKYFLIIWATTLVFNLPFVSKVKFNIDSRYFTGYIGYLVLGYYLAYKNFRLNSTLLYSALVVGSILFTAIGTYYLSLREHVFAGSLYDYLTPNVLALSIGIFMLLKKVVITNPFMIKIIELINRYSFGIYFIHMLFLNMFANIGLTWSFINPIIGIPVMTTLCLLASLCTIYLLEKLPYGKYII